MAYVIKGYPPKQINLQPTSTVEEVLQNLAVLLSTFQGSAPMGRGIGLKGSFLDKPTPVAEALLVAEVNQAVTQWEPRASVLHTTFEYDTEHPERLIPVVEVEIDGE